MTKPLYDTDFDAWTQQQAQALQEKDWAALDLVNLIEEVEDLAQRHRDAAESYLEVILLHALKWHYQPQERPPRGRGWRNSMNAARRRLRKLWRDHSSVRATLPQRYALVYDDARAGAADETDLPLATFPETCPWGLDEVLQDSWLPPDAEG